MSHFGATDAVFFRWWIATGEAKIAALLAVRAQTFYGSVCGFSYQASEAKHL
jgi:hypothetical protein